MADDKIQHLEDYEHQFLEILAQGLKNMAEKELQAKQSKEKEDSKNETTDSE